MAPTADDLQNSDIDTIKANIQTAHEQIEQQQTLKVNLEAKLEELAAKEKQLLADMPGTDDGETWVLHADDVKFLNAGEESDAHIEALEAKLRMAKKHRDARKDPKFARLEAASRVAGNKERNLNRRVRDVMDKCMKPQGEIEGLEEQRELLEMQSARASSDATEKHDESVEIGDEADIKDADNSTVKLGIMFWEEKQEMKAELSSHEGSDLEDETPANERKRKAEDDPIAGSSKRAGRERVADMEEDEVDDSDDGTASDRAFVVDDGGDAGGADGGADDEEGSERQEEEEDLNGDEEETEEEDEADHGEGDSGSEEEDGDNLAAKK